MLLVVVTTIVTAMGLSREREQGTLEQVVVTPIPATLLLAGKMTPFVFIGFFDVLLLVTVAGTWVFGVPLRGNLAVMALATLPLPALHAGRGAAHLHHVVEPAAVLPGRLPLHDAGHAALRDHDAHRLDAALDAVASPT